MEWPLQDLCNALLSAYKKHNSSSTFTVAISGIDASGKGTIAGNLHAALSLSGLKPALIRLDDWQMPKSISLMKENAAENFYYNSFRWHALFNQVISPLKKTGNLQLHYPLIQMDKDEVITASYDFRDVDIILLEGIFLFKKEFISQFDFRIWVNCSFDNGLKRALKRNQECLQAEDLLYDYLTYYYPAQMHHFNKDNPGEQVDFVFNND